MPAFRRPASLAVATLTLAFVCSFDAPARERPRAPVDGTAATWRADVVRMADADDNAARRAYLRQRLAVAGMAPTTQTFEHASRAGENLIADVSGAAEQPLLLIGAHSDRVDVGRGATDNASGSAVALALAERFHRAPLRHHRVKVAFWDLEERGLLGAAAHVAKGEDKPALYVNFDVFGWGDSLWMMTPDADAPLVAASRAAAKAQGLEISAGKQYPPSDHLAFLKAQWPAVSYSLVGKDEIPRIIALISGKGTDPAPRVMAVIHSPDDTVEQIDPAAAAKGIDAVEAALRAWDAEAR